MMYGIQVHMDNGEKKIFEKNFIDHIDIQNFFKQENFLIFPTTKEDFECINKDKVISIDIVKRG